ncbi:MAG: ferredoxin family protein [Planctomycetes bacterium]|nr:ferredoxin family protein [Planctomycetota bacterium]
MNRHRITVVLSQAQGKHPGKRALEESIVAALIMEPGLDVSVIPHLYDLGADHTGRLFLGSVRGDMVLLSWLFPRAAFWVMDRDGIKGHWGESQLKSAHADDDDDAAPEPPKGIGSLDVPDRHIYCLDLRDFNQHEPYVNEIRRIAEESRARAEQKQSQRAPALVQLGGLGESAASATGGPLTLTPVAGAFGSPFVNGTPATDAPGSPFAPDQLLQAAGRRWYPVIDYSRCTNCMECIDFCLFGVYGVDGQERILVENQDNCKKGCPACSRVCPEQAIMFPDYKTAAIAGAPVGAIGNLKIDLTKLFGGADKDALSQAVEERDRELVADGRDAVGATVGIPKRQNNATVGPKDDLDNLMDALDAMEI